jgi:crossover junction endodeoxyribonuclease RusA
VEALMLHVTLPYPPSVNHYWRHVGLRVLISRQGRAFRDRVRSILAAAGVRPMSGPLAIHIVFHPPDNRRRDIDNVQKALLDALEHGGAYFDDSQIVRLAAEKRAAQPNGSTIIRIEEFHESCSMDCQNAPASSTMARTEKP